MEEATVNRFADTRINSRGRIIGGVELLFRCLIS